MGFFSLGDAGTRAFSIFLEYSSKGRVTVDRPTSNETATFIERDIVMIKEDAEQRNPALWIEQRTFESGKEVIKARQLFILGRVVDGNVYIFKECGDQIAGVEKLPDLHLTARIVSPCPVWLSEERSSRS